MGSFQENNISVEEAKRLRKKKKRTYNILRCCCGFSGGIAWILHCCGHEFFSSAFLNVMGGLLTGILIYYWGIENDKINNEMHQLLVNTKSFNDPFYSLKKISEPNIKFISQEPWASDDLSWKEIGEKACCAQRIQFFWEEVDCRKNELECIYEPYLRLDHQLVVKRDHLLKNLASMEDVLSSYQIEMINFAHPNYVSYDGEISLLPEVPILYKNGVEVELDQCRQLAQEISNFNDEINIILQMIEKLKERDEWEIMTMINS